MCARKEMTEIKSDKCRYLQSWGEENEWIRRKKWRNKDTERVKGRGNGGLGEILKEVGEDKRWKIPPEELRIHSCVHNRADARKCTFNCFFFPPFTFIQK